MDFNDELALDFNDEPALDFNDEPALDCTMNLLDILTAPGAIRPEKLIEIRDLYLAYVRGDRLDLHAIEAKLGPAEEPGPYQVTAEGVAIIPICCSRGA